MAETDLKVILKNRELDKLIEMFMGGLRERKDM